MNPLALAKYGRRVLVCLLAFGGLFLMMGCGSGSGVIPPLGGGFSNSSLKGQFVVSQTGIAVNQAGTSSDPFSETVIFTADGAGKLSVVVDDFDQDGVLLTPTLPVSGTYNIRNDGTGSLVVNYSVASNYAITMIDDNHFYIIEQDTYATASGYGEKQDTSAFATPPSGNFVFKAHTLDTRSRVGGMTITSGAIAGTEDYLTLGVLSTNQAIASSSSMTTPDPHGAGTFKLTDGSKFNYYVVSATKFRIMSQGLLEIGQAEMQTGAPFSLATLGNGRSYVFGSAGDTAVSGAGGIHSAGVFTSDGNGNITGGEVDYVQDSTVNQALNVSGGAYTLAANGRGTVNLALSAGTISPQIFWLVNGEIAYFLANSALAVEDGTFYVQSGAFSISKQAAFFMDGFDTAYKDRVGLYKTTTAGAFNWNQAANSFDTSVFPPLATLSAKATNGTYQISSNGRTTVSVNGVTGNLVFYLFAPDTGFIVQQDADIGGAFAQQASQ